MVEALELNTEVPGSNPASGIFWEEEEEEEEEKKKGTRGVMRESNSRPLAPEARIIPLDQSPKCTQQRTEKALVV